MPEIGATRESLVDLQNRFGSERDAVNQLIGRLGRQVDATDWTGKAANEFKGAWHGEFKPALNKLVSALDSAQREVSERIKRLDDFNR
jgi:WXG100 family type VII secretion target